MAKGEGLPSLPKKYVEKILAGEYIDFAELPPAKGKVKSIPNTVEGQIVVVQAADLLETRPKLIPDLATWVQCFGIYAAVITSKDPTRIKNLFAYLTLIAKCSHAEVPLAKLCRLRPKLSAGGSRNGAEGLE